MDNRTSYARMKNLLIKHGKEKMTLEEIKSVLRMYISSNPKTIQDNLKIMVESGLIVEKGAFNYRVVL